MQSDAELFIHYITEYGKALYIAGNSQILGNWDPFRAKRMEWTQGNVWKSEIQIHTFEYKYFVADYYNPYQQVWEIGPNRKLCNFKKKENKKKRITDYWNYREIEFQCLNQENYQIQITGTTFCLGNCQSYRTMTQTEQSAIYNFQFNPYNDELIVFECQAQMKGEVLSVWESVNIKQVRDNDECYYFNILIIQCNMMEQYLLQRSKVEEQKILLINKQIQFLDQYSVESTQDGITTNQNGITINFSEKQDLPNQIQCICSEMETRQCGNIEGKTYFCKGCNSNGAVWGSNPYTSNSDICRAAKHAGVISDQGGQFIVQRCPGYSQYEASIQNRIATKSYDNYPFSVLIMRTDQAGRCGRINEKIYYCMGCQSNGIVWGNNPYTSDSDICRAARHAGIISKEGGVFVVEYVQAQSSYISSTQNGITTNCYGKQCLPNQTQIKCSEMKTRQCGNIEGKTYFCKGCNSNGAVWGRGQFIVQRCPGYSSYEASIQNGIATKSFDNYPSSVLLMRTDQFGRCGRINEKIYYCMGCQSNGVIQGKNPYTNDLDICKAARDAGIIGNEGGVFLVQQ